VPSALGVEKAFFSRWYFEATSHAAVL
jgi:hypothetical protein